MIINHGKNKSIAFLYIYMNKDNSIDVKKPKPTDIVNLGKYAFTG